MAGRPTWSCGAVEDSLSSGFRGKYNDFGENVLLINSGLYRYAFIVRTLFLCLFLF